MRLRSFIATMALAVTAAPSSSSGYSSEGPCVPTSGLDTDFQTKLPEGKNAKLRVRVTVPGAGAIKAPYPVLFFFNGFQVP